MASPTYALAVPVFLLPLSSGLASSSFLFLSTYLLQALLLGLLFFLLVYCDDGRFAIFSYSLDKLNGHLVRKQDKKPS